VEWLPHVSAEDLGAYASGRLRDLQANEIQEHLRICTCCQDHLTRLDLDRVSSLRSIHITSDGPIFSSKRRLDDGTWEAYHWGQTMEGVAACKTAKAAEAYLIESFRQMFPEHVCSDRCRSRDGHHIPSRSVRPRARKRLE
jgi:hypothetical protein